MIKSKQTYENAAIDYDGNVLQDIHLPSKNIAIYERSIAPLKTELADLATKTVECRASGTVKEILAALKTDYGALFADYPGLFADVAELLKLFERTAKASSFRLLLTTVRTNMCRRFHTDINDLRMLCTYVGPGTLWLPDTFVNREAYHAEGSNTDIVEEASQIQQAGAGDVVLLKGALYPEANPILHRSPSIEEKGENRLLLRIDTNASQTLWI